MLAAIWDSGGAGMRLTSVISLAVQFFLFVLVIAAGALHLFLHLFQLIQVNPSNQLKVTAYLKKAQTNDGTMNYRRNAARPGGELLSTSLSCDCVFGMRTKNISAPEVLCFTDLSRGGSILCSHIPPCSMELSTLDLPYQA